MKFLRTKCNLQLVNTLHPYHTQNSWWFFFSERAMEHIYAKSYCKYRHHSCLYHMIIFHELSCSINDNPGESSVFFSHFVVNFDYDLIFAES